jgi:hypothetical protein
MEAEKTDFEREREERIAENKRKLAVRVLAAPRLHVACSALNYAACPDAGAGRARGGSRAAADSSS